jgi:hypothetical protein
MLGIFKANNHFNGFLLFFYGLLLKLPWFLNPTVPAPQDTDNFLFHRLLSLLSTIGSGFPLIYPMIAYILLFTQAISINKLVNSQRLLPKPNYLPGMSYLLITSLFTEWNILSSPLLINTLLIWILWKMSHLHNLQKAKATLFDIGAVIGVATFFYFPAIAILALVIMALMIMRPFRLDEWLMVAIGIVTPYYLLYSYLFISDKIQNYRLPAFTVGYPKFTQEYWPIIAMALVVISFLVGGYFVRTNMRRQVVHTRKTWNLILLYLVVAVFVPFVNSTYSFVYWILTTIPLAIFIGCGFYYPTKRALPGLLHFSMLALVIVMHFVL